MRRLIAGLGLLILLGWWSPTAEAAPVDQVCKAVPTASVGITVRVERSDRAEPVAGAVVTLYRVDSGYKGRSDLVSVQQTTTNVSGSYCFVASPDLRYRIKLEALPLGLAIKALRQNVYVVVGAWFCLTLVTSLVVTPSLMVSVSLDRLGLMTLMALLSVWGIKLCSKRKAGVADLDVLMDEAGQQKQLAAPENETLKNNSLPARVYGIAAGHGGRR